MQKIEAMTQGRLRVGPGTLYNLLARFEKEDIVNQVQGSGKKKCYLLTPRGEVFLKKELERLKQLVIDGERILQEDEDEKYVKA